jgi:hypothetical protein
MERIAYDNNLLRAGLLHPFPQGESFFIGATDFVSKYDYCRVGHALLEQDLAAPKDDDGIGVRKWVVNNPSLCNSCEKRRVEEPGERSESNNTDRACNVIAKPSGAGFKSQKSDVRCRAETRPKHQCDPCEVRFRADLDVYKKAYTLAMRVLEMSRSFDASRKCTATDVSDRKS